MSATIVNNAQYVQDPYTYVTNGIQCQIDGVDVFVPIDDANRDYAMLMQMVADGTLTIEDAE